MNLKAEERIILMSQALLNYPKKSEERKRKVVAFKTEMNKKTDLSMRQTDPWPIGLKTGHHRETDKKVTGLRKITAPTKDQFRVSGPSKVTGQTPQKDHIPAKNLIAVKDLQGTGRMRDLDQNKDRQVKIVLHRGIVRREIVPRKGTAHREIVLLSGREVTGPGID